MTTEIDALTPLPSANDGAQDPVLPPRRAPRIREEDVRLAADALLIEGGRPTVERVRSRLGRGSPNTIALFLDRWWAQLGARLRDLPGQELRGVPEPVSRALLALWSQAIDQARALLHDSVATRYAEVEAQRAALDARSANLERTQTEFARERAALEETVVIVQKQLAEANERHRADAGRLEELRRECSRLANQHETARREAAEHAARLEAIRQSFEEERQSFQARVNGIEHHWAKQVDEARLALSAERKRFEAFGRQNTAEIEKLRERLQITQAERGNLQMELARTGDALAAARAECERLQSAVRKHEIRADDALKNLQEAQAAARQQFEVLQQQLGEVLGARRRFGPSNGDRRMRSGSKKATRGG